MFSPATNLTLQCPAKVNLALSVGPPREDGLHPIASWMVAVDFGDQLTLRRSDASQSTWRIAFAEDAPVTQRVDWPLEDDLAYRAHRHLARYTGQPLTVDVELIKRVPAGAGLGGGSSDAAGVLVGLNRLFDLRLSGGDLRTLAAQLGSDVAFAVAALRRTPSAIVSGVGEHLAPAPMPAAIDMALVLPPFGCPTRAVYAAFDAQTPHRPARRPAVIETMHTLRPLDPNALFNDLALPACRVQPQLGSAMTVLSEALRTPVHVTGSGSTLFVVARSPAHARQLAADATRATGFPARPTRTLLPQAEA